MTIISSITQFNGLSLLPRATISYLVKRGAVASVHNSFWEKFAFGTKRSHISSSFGSYSLSLVSAVASVGASLTSRQIQSEDGKF